MKFLICLLISFLVSSSLFAVDFEINSPSASDINWLQRVTFDFSNSQNAEFFTYGVKGAVRHGFTHQIDITRREARYLWWIMQNKMHDTVTEDVISRRRDIFKKHYETLLASEKTFNFTWQTEGEILEALVLMKLRKDYSPRHYSILGGVSYFDKKHDIGEIDFTVVKKSNQEVVAFGEVKLGHQSLSKAKKQLKRIKMFLVCSPLF